MISESTKQRICIKFCFKIEKTATETYQLLQWVIHKCLTGFVELKKVEPPLKATPHSGRPSTLRNEEMIAKVRTFVHNNRRLTVREIADDCGICVGSCEAILTDDLHIKRVCAKFVPRLLTDDQREQCQTISRDLFEQSCEDVQFLKNTVTGDESWVYRYDPETKRQLSQWRGPTSLQPKKGRQLRSKIKVVLLAFFWFRGYRTPRVCSRWANS